MQKLKESGVNWIGKIPPDWKLNKIAYIYEERNEKTSEQKNPPLSVTQNGIVPKLDKVAKSRHNDVRKLVCKNDFVINSRSDRRGACGIAEQDGSVSLIYLVIKPKKNVNNLYYSYVFKCDVFSEEFYRQGSGIVDDLWSTKWKNMKQIYVPCPSIQIQEAIANFLNEKCSQINLVIEMQKSIIIKLREYRQAIISETVTKGLNKSAIFKETNIEWIGKIPKNWKIIRLKFCTTTQNKKRSSLELELKYIGLENIESNTGKYIETENVYDKNQTIFCDLGNVIFSKLRPYLAKAYEVTTQSCCSREFVVFENFSGNSSYLKYIFLSDWFIKIVDASTYGTKMPRAGIEFIKNMQIPLSEVKEQDEIVEYLNNVCMEIDLEVHNRNDLLDRLLKYKKSLIYEAVTGKIRV